MALEARAFSAPARRTALRQLPDTSGQRALRWIVGLGSIALVVIAVAGLVSIP